MMCCFTARWSGGRQRDAENQRPAGSSPTQRHDGRALSELRPLPQY